LHLRRRMPSPLAGAGLLAAPLLLQALPSVTALRPVRMTAAASLAGISRRPHVGLSFDDGPHPELTPAFLGELERLGARASFFLLGEQLVRNPETAREIIAGGHEVGIHGWSHRCHLLRSPRDIAFDMRRARAAVMELLGTRPVHWRPPYGILTASAWRSARALGLRPVLWTAEGREWKTPATPESIVATVLSQLRPGGVVLLHDSDAAMAAGAPRPALGALREIVGTCRTRGWEIGPLAEHW
jgi:peptidoglycan-N-acetylglucosamine deacetylase